VIKFFSLFLTKTFENISGFDRKIEIFIKSSWTSVRKIFMPAHWQYRNLYAGSVHFLIDHLLTPDSKIVNSIKKDKNQRAGYFGAICRCTFNKAKLRLVPVRSLRLGVNLFSKIYVIHVPNVNSNLLCITYSNLNILQLFTLLGFVPASTISNGHKIFGFPKENYNASNWGLVIEIQNLQMLQMI